MVDKLKDSPFFGDRIINFTASIIGGRQRLDPVTQFEKKLLLHEEEIRQLDKDIKDGLPALLRFAKDSIPPATALRMLFYLQTKGLTELGHQIIYFSARDGRVLSDQEINEIVAEVKRDPTTNIEWYLTLLDAGNEAQEDVGKKKPTLNLPTDFK